MTQGQGTGTKGICRYCSSAVEEAHGWGYQDTPGLPEFTKEPGPWGGIRVDYRYANLHWRHTETLRLECVPPDDSTAPSPYDGRTASPRDVCCHVKGTGGPCHKPVPEENWSDGLFSCGVHLKKERAMKEHADRVRKEKARKEEEQLIGDWHEKEVSAARVILQEMGWGSLLKPSPRHYGRDRQEVSADIVEIARFLAKEGYLGPDSSFTDEQDEDEGGVPVLAGTHSEDEADWWE